ncbi:MAG: hypothetical protein ACI311_00830 [Bacilli bacterium]
MAKKTTKKCPSCKSMIDVNEKTCPYCFHQFEENANRVHLSNDNQEAKQSSGNESNFRNEKSTLLSIDEKVEPKQESVLYCTVCGSKLSYNDAYCNNCGAPNKLYGTQEVANNNARFAKNSDGSRSFKDATGMASIATSGRKQMDLTLLAGLGLFLSIFVPIFGLIMSISALQSSKKVYADNPTMRVRITILSICGIIFSVSFWIYSTYINLTTDPETETILLRSLL